MSTYDVLGQTYSQTRRPDPRVAERINAALGDAVSVVNVGAGTGSYEPVGTIWAIEPSGVMIRQRPMGAAPAIKAGAESIPLSARCADAALAVLTMHHWDDPAAGVREMRRIARKRIVILTWDPESTKNYWLFREYLPIAGERDAQLGIAIEWFTGLLDPMRIETVEIPHDCVDGFMAAYWRRPAAYLDPIVRAGMSSLALSGADALQSGLKKLAADVASGHWAKNHSDILDLESLDVGYRLLIAEI